MKLISNGKQVVNFLQNNESLISGQLRRFSVYLQDGRLFSDLDVTLMYSKKFKNLSLRFIDVLEYSFTYDRKNYFYNIEDYKLLITDEKAYISLDPVDGSSIQIDKDDNDFVTAKELHVYV